MGHKQRGFFLGETEKLLFDRNGNGGTTAGGAARSWGWLPRPAGDARGPGIELVLCDKVPARVEALRGGDQPVRDLAPDRRPVARTSGRHRRRPGTRIVSAVLFPGFSQPTGRRCA